MDPTQPNVMKLRRCAVAGHLSARCAPRARCAVGHIDADVLGVDMQGADQHRDRCSDRDENVSLRYRLKRHLDFLAFYEIMKNSKTLPAALPVASIPACRQG